MCHMTCNSTADNTTVQRAVIADWYDGVPEQIHPLESAVGWQLKERGHYWFLLRALAHPQCKSLLSFSTSITGQDINNMDAMGNLNFSRSSAPDRHEDYSIIQDNLEYFKKATAAFSFGIDTNYIWAKNNFTTDHAFFQRFDRKRYVVVNASVLHTYGPPAQFIRNDAYPYSVHGAGTLQLSYTPSINTTLQKRTNALGQAQSSFIRLNLRSGVVFDNKDKECFSAMISGNDLWDFALWNFTDTSCDFTDSSDVVCPSGHKSNFTTYNNNYRVGNEELCINRLFPDFPLDVKYCDRLELHSNPNQEDDKRCRPVPDPCTENNVSVSDLAVLDAFVQAAKKDNSLQSQFLRDMSYEDLYGLYIGLLAGAVPAAIAVFTSVVGLLLLYLLRR